MDDPALPRLFTELFETGLRDRNPTLARSIQQVNERMSARGVLQSGMTVTAIRDLLVSELRARANLAWEQLQAVLSQLGFVPSESAVGELARLLDSALDSQGALLSARLDKESAPLAMRTHQTLDADLANLKRELRARAELLVLSLQRQRATGGSGPVFNFHGAVGAVQTGSGANANISVIIGSAAAAQLQTAMDEVVEKVAIAPELSQETRNEITAVAADVQHELASPQPNRLRLGQLAIGVATAIQAAGSLQPAYAVLKAALHAIGITVP